MHYGNDEESLVPDLIDYRIGKPVCTAASRPLGNWSPGFRILDDLFGCSLNLVRELKAEFLPLFVIILNCLDEL